jgi:hypothetical protein
MAWNNVDIMIIPEKGTEAFGQPMGFRDCVGIEIRETVFKMDG